MDNSYAYLDVGAWGAVLQDLISNVLEVVYNWSFVPLSIFFIFELILSISRKDW